MRLAIPLLLLTATAVAAAPPTVTPVPRSSPEKWVEVTAVPGRLLVLAAEPASKWVAVDEDGADFVVVDNGKTAVFASMTAGRYKVIVTSPDGNSTRLVVVVGEAPPPKPPEPTDELTKKLKAAYDADAAPAADKVEAAKELAELYKQVAKLSGDPTLKTAKDLMLKAKETATALLGPDQLKAARSAVSDELKKIFPADGDLTADQRQAAETLFTKLSDTFTTLAK